MVTTEALLKGPRTRRKDRPELIIGVASRLFSERGYHAVSLDDIGEAAGITGSAVYRHFESKEALLVTVIERMVDQYGEAYQQAVQEAHTPVERLRELAHRTIGPQIDQNNFWPLALAELRHLPPAMVRTTSQKAAQFARLWVEPLQELHPQLSRKDAEFAVAVGGCMTPTLLAYQPQLPRARVVVVLTEMLLSSYIDGFAAVGPGEAAAAVVPAGDPWPERPRRSSARERILALAIPMFRQHGFNGVGIDGIGAAAGVTGPGVYRHFKNKEEILYAAMSRVAEQLTASVNRALTRSSGPAEAVESLVDSYLELTVGDSDMMAVFWGQEHALGQEQRQAIVRAKRAYADDWVSVLVQLRPDISEAEARVMTYGVLGIMNGFWQGQVALPGERARVVLRDMVLIALRATDAVLEG